MSIRQNTEPSLLPDFANLGVWLRSLLGANALALLFGLARNQSWAGFPEELVLLAAAVEPPLIASVLILTLLRPLCQRLSYVRGAGVVFAVVLAATAVMHLMLQRIGFENAGHAADALLRALFWAALCAAALLAYFALRARLQSPALAEARLMALTARIRPHFLFNSLNAVLGVMRVDPRRAERALEELSDLFRALMRDNRELAPLSDEIALARQYLELERLRLGERLQVKWDIEACPPDALAPPLMLQPLLENAVYHGIEPAEQPGEITIRFARNGDEVLIELTNPIPARPETDPHVGNQMALANIRERLMLFYDLEARLETIADNGIYRVRIVLPYRRGGKP